MLDDLVDIMGLGIGLYLALGVVQAVSSGGVSNLRRRADSLQRTVGAAKMAAEFQSTRTLQLEVGRLEISFESLNRSVVQWATVLFFVALAPYLYASLQGDIQINFYAILATIAYYIVLPTSIYTSTSLIISKRCANANAKLKAAETRIKNSLLGV